MSRKREGKKTGTHVASVKTRGGSQTGTVKTSAQENVNKKARGGGARATKYIDRRRVLGLRDTFSLYVFSNVHNTA